MGLGFVSSAPNKNKFLFIVSIGGLRPRRKNDMHAATACAGYSHSNLVQSTTSFQNRHTQKYFDSVCGVHGLCAPRPRTGRARSDFQGCFALTARTGSNNELEPQRLQRTSAGASDSFRCVMDIITCEAVVVVDGDVVVVAVGNHCPSSSSPLGPS